jgi:predicted metalloprotease
VFAELGAPAYATLAGGLREYRPSVDPLPTCGPNPVAEAVARGNAFYCGADDAVTWDRGGVEAGIRTLSGPVGVALVLAHEWGHAVQRRLGGPPKGPARELQADCYAGAFTAWAVSAQNPELIVTGPQVDGAVAGYLTLRDATEVDGGGHGTAFDRIGAFADGFGPGAPRCLEYRDHPPQLAAPGSVASPGALQMTPGQTVDLVTTDLEVYWRKIVADDTGTGGPVAASQVALAPGQAPPACPSPPGAAARPSASPAGGVVACPATATISWDLDGFLAPLGAQVGDFGVALALATGWSELVVARRSPMTHSPRDMADCLSGSWAADASHDLTPTGLHLEPGDLDEALAGMLALRASGGSAGEVTAFRRASAFQRGFDEGRKGCVTYG